MSPDELRKLANYAAPTSPEEELWHPRDMQRVADALRQAADRLDLLERTVNGLQMSYESANKTRLQAHAENAKLREALTIAKITLEWYALNSFDISGRAYDATLRIAALASKSEKE